MQSVNHTGFLYSSILFQIATKRCISQFSVETMHHLHHYEDMAKHNEIKAQYCNDGGSFTTWDKAQHIISENSNPYQYLLGALSGCFYYTFRDIATKKEVSYEKLEFQVKCTKREQIPTTMDNCTMRITAFGVENREAFAQAIDRTCETCSIYYTLNQVAKITVDVEFA